MTTIKFKHQDGNIYGFEILGHAGFNLKGPDILCSAISVTSQMVINRILKLQYPYNRLVIEDGKVIIEVGKMVSKTTQVKTLFGALYDTYKDLSENPEFKDFIRIEEEY